MAVRLAQRLAETAGQFPPKSSVRAEDARLCPPIPIAQGNDSGQKGKKKIGGRMMTVGDDVRSNVSLSYLAHVFHNASPPFNRNSLRRDREIRDRS